MLLVILVACLAAPLYASLVSGTDPFRSNLSGKIMVGGKRVGGHAAFDRGPAASA